MRVLIPGRARARLPSRSNYHVIPLLIRCLGNPITPIKSRCIISLGCNIASATATFFFLRLGISFSRTLHLYIYIYVYCGGRYFCPINWWLRKFVRALFCSRILCSAAIMHEYRKKGCVAARPFFFISPTKHHELEETRVTSFPRIHFRWERETKIPANELQLPHEETQYYIASSSTAGSIPARLGS